MANENPIHNFSSSSSSTIASTNPSQIDSIVTLNLLIATKLTQSNFLTWKSQILPILHGYNLTKFISSLPPNSTITTEDNQIAPNPEFLPWHRQDQLLLDWLRSSLPEVIQAQLVSCDSTFDLWMTLQRIFSNRSRARLTDLRRQIQTATEGGSTCTEFIQHMRKLADELLFIGSPLSDDELVTATLNGLGSDFLPFITSVTTAARSDPISFSDFCGLLLCHESLLQSHRNSDTVSAFNTSRQSSYQPRNQYRSGNTSYNTKSNNSPQYGNTGYTNNKPSSQPKVDNTSTQRPPVAPKVLCQICSKPGHPAKLCYFRYENDPN